MTRDEAVAHVRRLCPPGTLEALGRPTGGHVIGRVVEQQSARPDARAEADEEPTRRERRPSGTSQQIAAVTTGLREMGDTLAASLERKP